jgi:hypothetical protein
MRNDGGEEKKRKKRKQRRYLKHKQSSARVWPPTQYNSHGLELPGWKSEGGMSAIGLL